VLRNSLLDAGARQAYDVGGGKIMDWTEVQELGDKMAGLSKEDAEALREYLIYRYEILPGCVEGLVWHKYGLKQGRWAKPEAQSDFFAEFCRQFVVIGAPGG